ncbi:apoptotic chromatin condensation inducer in the nucleus [Stomoxys calcitrans]|uniref:RRM domain-containing protein n=1 Tax=Stomoxys calcitrans TaxID=35570 RepID=A0A1I8Q1N8_STOCA|nr:apoptotic chromatin condensation inducer in the nucleus [Stomoxys calcitrans]
MRRRSERKKSTDVSSPAVQTASRRTNRRRKSPSISEDDQSVEPKNNDINEKNASDVEEKARDSSEEQGGGSILRRRRSSRSTRTPIKELEETSPVRRRRNRREPSPENNIPAIQEEEICNSNDVNSEKAVDDPKESSEVSVDSKQRNSKDEDGPASPDGNKKPKDSGDEKEENQKLEVNQIGQLKEVSLVAKTDESNSNDDRPNRIDDDESRSSVKSVKETASIEDQDEKDDQDEVKLYTRDNSPRSRSNSSERKEIMPKRAELKEDEEETEDGEVVEKEETNDVKNDVSPKKDHHKLEEVNHNQDGKTNETSNTTAAADTGRHIVSSNNSTTVATTSTRKRRWITKKATESKEPILAISTDSLKTLIADVHPVPLSDVQLESSSDVEDVTSEREEGEQSPSPEPERRRISPDKIEISVKPRPQKEINRQNQLIPAIGTVPGPIQRLPSPARNQASCVLYITNLVRPFTVLQLKGLLARTGKIVENGFWIDRIKSKCFVEYETEDEAIETRHALHGVRWPASNPKCLNVDFGNKSDMLKAIETTKEEVPKFGQETNKDNVIVGSGWNRDRHEEEKRGSRPVREWDVGKKENLDRDNKGNRDMERRRERSRERERDNSRNKELERNDRDRNDRERNERDKERRRRDREIRTNSLSPARKQKKKDDPPLRLLDDLFRKTKGTPCIYWLPLTPEQIAEKEALRLKRLEEQQQRLKQREQEREKERERERERRDRDRNRRPRSSDRRRSRSRDRRRY